jgi:uncharacterized protein (DUF4415 family)
MSNSPKTWAEARAAAAHYAKSITADVGVQIEQGIEADPDASELVVEDFERMKPARRGRPRKPTDERKRSVTLRLSPDVIEAYRSSGPGWHRRIDEALRRAAPRVSPPTANAAAPAGLSHVVTRAESRKVSAPPGEAKLSAKGSRRDTAGATSASSKAARLPSKSSPRKGGRSSSTKW